jgi:hypothetical protein
MPWLAKASELNRLMAKNVPVAPRPTARPIGAAHQACIRLRPSVTAMAAIPPTASLAASHRVRVTDWFQARTAVPVSSSPAISGAPQNRPVTAGASRMTAMVSSYSMK